MAIIGIALVAAGVAVKMLRKKSKGRKPEKPKEPKKIKKEKEKPQPFIFGNK